jgi:hypothetical protein
MQGIGMDPAGFWPFALRYYQNQEYTHQHQAYRF